MALLPIIKHIMENKYLPIALIALGLMQFMTIVFVLAIPTDKMELVCRGLFSTPNAIRCYEQ